MLPTIVLMVAPRLGDILPTPGSIVPVIRAPGSAECLWRDVKRLFELAEKIRRRAVAKVGRNFLDGKRGRLQLDSRRLEPLSLHVFANVDSRGLVEQSGDVGGRVSQIQLPA